MFSSESMPRQRSATLADLLFGHSRMQEHGGVEIWDLLGLRQRQSQDVNEESKMDDLVKKVNSLLLISGKTLASSLEERIKKIYKLQHTKGLLPELLQKPKKSNEEAHKLRVKGNQAFTANILEEALRLYTRAICCAESEGEEMAISYANRSAVTYRLKEYENAIADANRALSSGKYPKHLSQKLVERRGRCYLALGQYSKASEDFKQVIKLIMDTEMNAAKLDLVKMLNNLLEECIGKKDAFVKSPVPTPKLKHEPSPHIQCASSAVDIAYSPEMGRHIVATVDIAPGDILFIEKPYVSMLDRPKWDSFCYECKKRSHSSIPCLSCTDVMFCSELCRENNWIAYHSVECEMLHNLTNLGFGPYSTLAIQTLLKATKLGEDLRMFIDGPPESNESCKPERKGFVNGVYRSDHYQAIHHLATNIEKCTEAELNHLVTCASSILHVLKETTNFFARSDPEPNADGPKAAWALTRNHIVAAELLVRYMSVIESGSATLHRIHEIRWKRAGGLLELLPHPIGGAVCALNSLQNHSCDPDTIRCVYNGDTFITIAWKPIAKGQQIFGHYTVVFTKHGKPFRQQYLQSSLRFTCKCIACLEDWPTLSNMRDAIPKLKPSVNKNRFQLQFSKKLPALKEILLNGNQGKLTDDKYKTLIETLMMIHKNVKQPYEFYYLCQQALYTNALMTYNPLRVEENPSSSFFA